MPSYPGPLGGGWAIPGSPCTHHPAARAEDSLSGFGDSDDEEYNRDVARKARRRWALVFIYIMCGWWDKGSCVGGGGAQSTAQVMEPFTHAHIHMHQHAFTHTCTHT